MVSDMEREVAGLDDSVLAEIVGGIVAAVQPLRIIVFRSAA